MSLTTLVGTKWRVDYSNNIEIPGEWYNISFSSSYFNKSYTKFGGNDNEIIYYYPDYDAAIDIGVAENIGVDFITITGGTEATASQVIDWFETNASQVLSYTFDLNTLSLGSGTHSVYAQAKAVGYADSLVSSGINYTILPQLDTPTNLSVSGTTATFDEVEHAESYEFFVDGASIGEYSAAPQPPFTNVKIQGNGDFANGCSVTVDGVDITSQIKGYPGTPKTMTVNTSFVVVSSAGWHDTIEVYDAEGGNLVWTNNNTEGTYDLMPYLNNGYYIYLDLDS